MLLISIDDGAPPFLFGLVFRNFFLLVLRTLFVFILFIFILFVLVLFVLVLFVLVLFVLIPFFYSSIYKKISYNINTYKIINKKHILLSILSHLHHAMVCFFSINLQFPKLMDHLDLHHPLMNKCLTKPC